jgi:hypothetical protein
MEAWRLVRAAAEPRLARGGEAPLVGRRREFRLIEDALEEAAAGRGLLVGLAGEAGIGKSRLAVETRARAEAMGFTAWWAGAPSYSSSFPYHLVGELAERLAIGRAELERRAPDAAPLRALGTGIASPSGVTPLTRNDVTRTLLTDDPAKDLRDALADRSLDTLIPEIRREMGR